MNELVMLCGFPIHSTRFLASISTLNGTKSTPKLPNTFLVVIERHADPFGDVGRENRGDFIRIFLCYDDNAQFGA